METRFPLSGTDAGLGVLWEESFVSKTIAKADSTKPAFVKKKERKNRKDLNSLNPNNGSRNKKKAIVIHRFIVLRL